MGRCYERIDDGLGRWLEAQPLFFVATAPSGAEGHLNLSPKGGVGTFRVMGATTVAYLDLLGSGIETVAHLRENGRIVLMFCAFAGPPKIVRLHGTGRSVQRDGREFGELMAGFRVADDVAELVRGVVVVEATRVGDSCGFVVPRMAYEHDRDQLVRWGKQRAERDGSDWRERYQAEKNVASIDGLLGIAVAGDYPVSRAGGERGHGQPL
jgi:hypothetical protein